MGNLNLNNLKQNVHQSLAKTGLKKFLVAISGGSDSLLLLRILHDLSDEFEYSIRAIHINHNVSVNSHEMEECCINACKLHKIDLVIKNIAIKEKGNMEDYLRNQRYEKIFESMNDGEALVLAHHIDDQIETFFYRVFRGSSPIGLSCIKEFSTRSEKMICRPLLSISKKIILDSCKTLKIKFVDDETNNDISFDRNYIRNKIIPVIKNRWPGLNKVMKHNIVLQDTYKKISIDYCSLIYDHIVSNNKIDINILKSYPTYLHTIFLKYYVSKSINYELNKNELQSLLTLLLTNNNDYPKCILKNRTSIVRYNNYLHIIKEHVKRSITDKVWDLKSDTFFGDNKISIKNLKEIGVYDQLYKKAPITLKPFKGNEKIMLNSKNHQDLKKIFQNKSIPVWERERFIMLFSNDELLIAYGDEHTFISTEVR